MLSLFVVSRHAAVNLSEMGQKIVVLTHHYYIISNRCHFGCFITLFVISMYCTFSFHHCSIFLLKSSGFYNLLLKH